MWLHKESVDGTIIGSQENVKVISYLEKSERDILYIMFTFFNKVSGLALFTEFVLLYPI